MTEQRLTYNYGLFILYTMKKNGNNQKITKIGFFGFGNTGRMVADEFFKDGLFDLEWVVRKTHKDNHKYATRLLGYEVDDALIYSVDEVSPSFFQNHPVDIIVDFSSSKAHYQYASAADFGIKIISAISKYTETDLDDLKKWLKKQLCFTHPILRWA